RGRAKRKGILHRRHQLVLRIRLRNFHVRRRLPGNLRAKRIVRLRDVHHQVPKRIHLRRRLKHVLLRWHGLCRGHHVFFESRHACLHKSADGIRYRRHVRRSARRRRSACRWCRLLRKRTAHRHKHRHSSHQQTHPYFHCHSPPPKIQPKEYSPPRLYERFFTV